MKKKKVAIYYENGLGRNDGFPLYAFNLLKDKEKYPHIEAVHLLPDGNYAGYEDMDLNLWIDWGEDGLTAHLPYEIVWPEGPLAYYASDTHLGKEYRFETAKKADFVFFAQKPALDEYVPSKKNKVVRWLPHGVEPRAFPDAPVSAKKYDVAFVGHLVSPERVDALDAAFRAFPNFFYGRRLSRYVKDDGAVDDCADIFRKTKVVLNPPTRFDLNMRHFEASAAGSFQVTENVPGLKEIFGDSIATYEPGDNEEMVRLVSCYLEHEKEREEKAKRAHDIVLASETYEDRLNVMLRAGGVID